MADLTLAELFALVEEIGNPYQTPEEIEQHQTAIEAERAKLTAYLKATAETDTDNPE